PFTGLAADVDASVLPGRVGVAGVAELLQDSAGSRPRPGLGTGSKNEEGKRDDNCSQRGQHAIDRSARSSPLSSLVTVLLQSAPGEQIPPCPGEAGDEIGGLFPGDACSDELGDGHDSVLVPSGGGLPGPENEGDLALRRLAKVRRHDRGRAADDLLELLRQLPADRDPAVGLYTGQQPQTGGE